MPYFYYDIQYKQGFWMLCYSDDVQLSNETKFISFAVQGQGHIQGHGQKYSLFLVFFLENMAFVLYC